MLREMAETLEALSEKRAVVLVRRAVGRGHLSPTRGVPSSAHRSDVLYELPLRTDCQELRLSHLDERAIAEYLGRRFATRDLPPQLSQMLRTRTTGNPLFMCRVVDGWVENGVLDQEGGCATLSQLSRDVPETVEVTSVPGISPGICRSQLGAIRRRTPMTSSASGPRHRLSSASSTGMYGSPLPYWSIHCPTLMNSAPRERARSRKALTKRVLPMPGSPVTKATWRWPDTAPAEHLVQHPELPVTSDEARPPPHPGALPVAPR